MGFLKLTAKEVGEDVELDEQLWSDWIQILRDLVTSTNVNISSEALVILTKVYALRPENT